MELGPGIRKLLRRPPSHRLVEREVDDELTFHIETRIDVLVARGMTREQAREQAVREFGDIRAARDELAAIDRTRVGKARRADWWDELRHDVRFALRGLRRQPAFAGVAVMTLALGIGANAAIFSVVDAVLIKPLPYTDPDRLVSIWPEGALPKGAFDILRSDVRSLSVVAGYSTWRDVSVTGAGDPVRLPAAQTTDGLFDVLGARPFLGRTFERGEDDPGRGRVAILSYALWRERFGDDRDVLGRSMTIDGQPYAIVGVMPPSFRFPSPDVRLWLPAAADPRMAGEYWGTSPLLTIGRLAPGVELDRARAEVAAIIDRTRSAFPWRMPDAWGRNVGMVVLRDRIVGGARAMLLVLLGAVGLVLLVACVNVANLSLGRAVSREREIAIRAALGAGRARVIRQLLTESALLGLLGAAAGLALAYATVRILVAFIPAGTPRVDEVAVDGRVLAFAMALGVLTGLAFGVAPAVRASRADLRSALGEGARGSASAARRRFSEALVVAQVALAVILVAGAGLLVKSFWLLRQVDPGFRPEYVIAASVPMPSFASDTAPRSRAFYDAVVERTSAIAGVRSAAVASDLPFGGGIAMAAMEIEAHPTPPGEEPATPDVFSISGRYLETMGIPLIAGRAFTGADREDAPEVALVDEAAARRYWPGESAIGQRIRYVWLDRWITVVGVVGGVKRDSLSSEVTPTVYRPMRQGFPRSMRLVARTDLDPASLAPQLREVVAGIDPSVPVSDIRTLGDLIAESAARPRFTTMLLALFAGVALVLGAVGIYGVIANAVSRRTREIGVRMALGARARDVLGMVLREGGALAGAGVIAGVLGALAASRLLTGFLYGVAPSDPVVFAAVPMLLAAVALLACVIPARRAARVDPAVALRGE